MSDDLAGRVGSAAIAAWWTVLIGAIFLAVQWGGFLYMMHAKPAWVVSMWGEDIQWPTIQMIGIWMSAIFKLFLWFAATTALWLSLWARRLRRF